LSSGVSVPDDTADGILGNIGRGRILSDDFKRDRLFSTKVKFQDPIRRNIIYTFVNKKMVTISKTSKAKNIELNRNILCALMKYSIKYEKAVDFELALEYPMCLTPPMISHPDGKPRETDKSKLELILGYQKSDDDDHSENRG
jgi:hypothetical protein